MEDIKKGLVVDVLAYNSKVYYVITDGGGYGEQVYPIPVTGNETVLDAISKINGLPPVASKKRIWVARATPRLRPPGDPAGGLVRHHQARLRRPRTTRCSPTTASTWPRQAGSRPDSWLAKRLNPIDRVLGTVLLGSSTVNSIKNGSNGGTAPSS